MENGKNNGLMREMTETKERAVAWGFRGVLGLVMILLGIVGWFMTTTLSEVKTEITNNAKVQWDQIGKLNDSEVTTRRDLGILSQAVQDATKSNADAVSRLSDSERDHEQRLRTLEHPHS